ncbi:hypothetical protein Desaci_2321 [Desulfosporosinus acidiphilus SJ4]|uniref:Uncharacterized protein n=1 Tax=Desulfosporosinus acidiphilus (strain DSM 22704 / JCM 16185 / SJ4) TaxID=646529 RepID=I4D650_DESAJ|nr:hypothetical protein Desaci_2321 [Desulfosporosinus acidiphilus SJ4]
MSWHVLTILSVLNKKLFFLTGKKEDEYKPFVYFRKAILVLKITKIRSGKVLLKI